MKWIVILYLFYTSSLLGQSTKKIAQEVLAKQTTFWNNGDIEGFMQTYWKSDELLFLGKDGYTKGWQATLDRYHQRYPNRPAMGTLKFTLHEVHKRSKSVLSVIGEYYLTREGIEDLNGYFFLLMKNIKGEWLIVSDSTH